MNQPKHKTLVSVKLDVETRQRLLVLSESRDRSVHLFMQKAIEGYVEQEEQADRLRQETLARWEQVEAGKIVSNEAVGEWLESWGTQNEKEHPKC